MSVLHASTKVGTWSPGRYMHSKTETVSDLRVHLRTKFLADACGCFTLSAMSTETGMLYLSHTLYYPSSKNVQVAATAKMTNMHS